MIDLSGQTALVTGSTQGVGAAIAICLSQAGARVILHGLCQDQRAEETLARCRVHQPESCLRCCDLFQDVATIQQDLVHPILEQFPDVSLLVNNAGVFVDKPFLAMDQTTYDQTYHLNVKVGYFLSQTFAKYWIDRGIAGSILFTGSINGLLAEPTHTAYDASKAAVSGMVRSLCVALAPHRIRVNAIAPGLVRTPLTNQSLDQDPAALQWMALHTPNGSVPNADVCGPMAAFLLSRLAEHIHGQTIYIDGGMSAWQQPDPPDAYRRWMAERK